MHWPGIEPGSTAWEAAILTTIPPTLTVNITNDNWQNKFTEISDEHKHNYFPNHKKSLDCPCSVKHPSHNPSCPDICYRPLMHWPGIAPGSTAWEPAILTTIPPTLPKHNPNDTWQNKFTGVSDYHKKHDLPSHNQFGLFLSTKISQDQSFMSRHLL